MRLNRIYSGFLLLTMACVVTVIVAWVIWPQAGEHPAELNSARSELRRSREEVDRLSESVQNLKTDLSNQRLANKELYRLRATVTELRSQLATNQPKTNAPLEGGVFSLTGKKLDRTYLDRTADFATRAKDMMTFLEIYANNSDSLSEPDKNDYINTLIQDAQGEDAPARYLALKTIGYLRKNPDEAIPALIKGIVDPREPARVASERGLKRFGEKAIPFLEAALLSNDPNIREKSAEFLNRMQLKRSP